MKRNKKDVYKNLEQRLEGLEQDFKQMRIQILDIKTKLKNIDKMVSPTIMSKVFLKELMFLIISVSLVGGFALIIYKLLLNY